MIYLDWSKRNVGLNPREFRRFLNGQYKINLDAKLYSRGYTKDELWEANQQYWKENKDRIRQKGERSEKLKETNRRRKDAICSKEV